MHPVPTRLVTCLILSTWVLAAASLAYRDLWPEIATTPPPNFRAVVKQPITNSGSWRILAADPQHSLSLEPIGRLQTASKLTTEGTTLLTSDATIRVGDLLANSAAPVDARTVLEIHGASEIDAAGDLLRFQVVVRESAGAELLSVDARRQGDSIELQAQSPIPLWKWKMRLPYQPGGFVQSSLSPFDTMPGLQVGQSWSAHVVHPLTGKAQTCTVAVVARKHITWNQNPVPTLVVETRMAPITARTWVRPDGLVLRQEVPTPLRLIVLEREP